MTLTGSLPCRGANNSPVSTGKNFVLNLNNSLTDLLDPRKNKCICLYRLPDTFYENWKCILVRIAEPIAQTESCVSDS